MAESYSVTAVLSVRDKMTSGFRNAESAMSSFGSKTKSIIGMGAAMQVGMSAVNTAISAVTSNIGNAVSRADTLNQFPKLMNQMGLASESAANNVKKNLVKSIEGLPTSLDEIVSSTKSLAILTGDLDKASDTAVALNDAFLASGSSSADASRGLTQYTQMLSKGKVDQQSWNTLCETMGYGLDKAAKSMLGAGANQRDLYSALQDGTVTFDDFNKTLIELDKAEGGFADTARTSSVGIATSMANVQTAITAGLANSIDAINQAMKDSGVKWLEGGIAGTFDNVKIAVQKAFKGINKAISSLNIRGIVNGLKPAITVLGAVAVALGKVVTVLGGFANKHIKGLLYFVTALVALGAVVAIGRKVYGFLHPIASVEEQLGKAGPKAGKSTQTLKNGLSSLAKSAGIALIIASLAALALALSKLGALGTTAVVPLVTFAGVVSGLAVVFANVGTLLQASAVGIAVFAGSISAMALTMALVASTGTEGAVAMAAFAVSVSALGAVFAILGPLLTAGAVGLVAFGVAILAVGAGMALATPLISALTVLVSELGAVFPVIATSITAAVTQIVTVIGGALCNVINVAANAFSKFSGALTAVINAISGGFVAVLNAVSGVIKSIGTAAKNAGTGFQSVANGIKTIAGLSIVGVAKSLAAVAVGVGAIASKGANLGNVSAGLAKIQSSFSATATAAKTAVNKVNSAFRAGASGARSAGAYVSQGFAAGMRSCLGEIESAAARMAAAAEKAVRAKAKIKSPSRVTRELGRYYGEGWVNGIKDRYQDAKKAASNLVNVPSVGNYGFAYSGGVSGDYSFGNTISVDVPLYVNGKEFARATASDVEAVQNKRQTRTNRKKGVR